MRDPFEALDVSARKAVLWTVCTVLLLVVYAITFPRQVALVAMVAGFALLIMFHELGHFLMAKRAGMKVTEFFVGFGPRLWSVTRGETEYGIKAIPLGGYCKIIGMTNLEEVAPDDEERAYRGKRWGPKVLVAAAGPSMNFLIAGVLMFTVLFFAGDFRHRTPTTTIAEVTQGAKDAGLQPGDAVVAIDGKAVQKWTDIAPQVQGPVTAPHKDGDIVRFVVRRGDQVVTKTVVVHASTADPSKRIVAGIAPTSYLPHPGLLTSIAKSPREVVAVATDSVKALGDVFSPSGIKNYFRILAGDKSTATDPSKRFVSPVGFVRYSAQAVKAGWVDAVWLLLAINVFVGLFNLLPLLPFDGGHIAVATYERIASLIRRRRVQVDVAKLLPFTVAVVAVLGFIFVSAMFLDIAHPASNPF